MRVLAATLMVLAITGAAAILGPQLSGLLTPFPVFAGVLAVFTQAGQGPSAAALLLSGVVLGSYTFAVFFGIAAWQIERLGVAPTLVLATAGAALTHALAFIALRKRPMPP